MIAPLFPEVAKQAGESRTRQGRAEEEVRGPAAAGGGGEQAPPDRGGAPRSSVAYSEVTRRKRRPSLPGHLLRASHTDTASAEQDGCCRPRHPRGRG